MASSEESVSFVAGLGASLGIVHVLTGPDHLSAIATLTNGSNSRLQSFLLGVKWGCGHSIGIAVMFMILAIIPDFDISHFEHSGNILVGVMMILLGFFGVFRARKKYLASTEQSEPQVRTEADNIVLLHTQSQNELDYIEMSSTVDSCLPDFSMDERILSTMEAVVETDSTPRKGGIKIFEALTCCAISYSFLSRSWELFLAIFVGIFHGIAGAGGVLAVIPAISMKGDSAKAGAYLTMFFLTSIVSMGALACAWGAMAARLGSTALLELRIAVAAALLSVAIGVLWEVLLALNLLQAVFH
jgi:hypothetical protein